MIPEDYKQQLVSSGIQFMRSITLAYGTEEGMKLWDTIASTLDPDIKGTIFFAMLTGEFNDEIVLPGNTSIYGNSIHGTNKVARIKSIRFVTGLGLKEAKDLCDAVDSGQTKTIKCEPQKRAEAFRELRHAGWAI